jgi:hypothetical protein
MLSVWKNWKRWKCDERSVARPKGLVLFPRVAKALTVAEFRGSLPGCEPDRDTDVRRV